MVDVFCYVYIFNLKVIFNVVILIGVMDVVLGFGVIGVFINLFWFWNKFFEVSIEIGDCVWRMFFFEYYIR